MSSKNENRYTPLVKAIIKHSLIVSTGMNEIIPVGENQHITLQEWLVVETVVEQREEYYSMVELSRMAGLPPSTFFRVVTHLQKAGLVDKYRIQNNKKNIVLRPTELALKMYEERKNTAMREIWGDFFQTLDRFSDEDIETLTTAFTQLTKKLPAAQYSQNITLIKD